jgi:hypothetical protein
MSGKGCQQRQNQTLVDHYYEQVVKAIFESWPQLKTAKPKAISKRDLEAWAKRFSDKYSPH